MHRAEKALNCAQAHTHICILSLSDTHTHTRIHARTHARVHTHTNAMCGAEKALNWGQAVELRQVHKKFSTVRSLLNFACTLTTVLTFEKRYQPLLTHPLLSFLLAPDSGGRGGEGGEGKYEDFQMQNQKPLSS